MKVYNNKHVDLTENIQNSLEQVRVLRNFNVHSYMKAKICLLNQYMEKSKLDTCVVAVSGGIDSAVVLGLVKKASEEKGSSIKKIIAVTIPSFDGSVTNQKETIEKTQNLAESLNVSIDILDITQICSHLAHDIEKNLDQKNIDPWARGQLVSYVRTPSLYYYTTVLNSKGLKPILVGTINRDEGAYLGYLCKSGDSCVDVQLISDLHKSEVYKVAKELNIPQSIMNATPNGDMYDGRVDEEVFGAPYDFVELYLNYKNLTSNTWNSLVNSWKEEDFNLFNQYKKALEKLHSYNAHKYLGGSTAIHLDVLESAVKGGWIEGVHTSIHKNNQMTKIINTSKFVGYVDNAPILDNHLSTKKVIELKEITQGHNLLSVNERKVFKEWIDKNQEKMVKTNNYGYTQGENKEGSIRLAFYDENWAKILYERLLVSQIINPIFNEDDANTNFKPFTQWRAIGLNPLFRVMKYNEGDFLYPHYDDSYYESDKVRSLKSVVIVVQTATDGGATRFLKDNQLSIPFEKRDFSDKNVIPFVEDVEYSFKEDGSVLVFNHRLLHDGEKVIKGEKIIIRTDVMYEKTMF